VEVLGTGGMIPAGQGAAMGPNLPANSLGAPQVEVNPEVPVVQLGSDGEPLAPTNCAAWGAVSDEDQCTGDMMHQLQGVALTVKSCGPGTSHRCQDRCCAALSPGDATRCVHWKNAGFPDTTGQPPYPGQCPAGSHYNGPHTPLKHCSWDSENNGCVERCCEPDADADDGSQPQQPVTPPPPPPVVTPPPPPPPGSGTCSYEVGHYQGHDLRSSCLDETNFEQDATCIVTERGGTPPGNQPVVGCSLANFRDGCCAPAPSDDNTTCGTAVNNWGGFTQTQDNGILTNHNQHCTDEGKVLGQETTQTAMDRAMAVSMCDKDTNLGHCSLPAFKAGCCVQPEPGTYMGAGGSDYTVPDEYTVPLINL
jgi:hypothetical protein